MLVRALECLRDAALAKGEFGEAVRHADEVTELEPFRESSYRALMQAHAAAGDPAEALRVYERCRRFLADELGAYTSPASEAVYLELLRSCRAVRLPGPMGSEPTASAPSRRRRRTTSRVGEAAVRSLRSSPASCSSPPAPRSPASPSRQATSLRRTCFRPASSVSIRRRWSQRRS
jgi:pentatricopeptide repeat protein